MDLIARTPYLIGGFKTPILLRVKIYLASRKVFLSIQAVIEPLTSSKAIYKSQSKPHWLHSIQIVIGFRRKQQWT